MSVDVDGDQRGGVDHRSSLFRAWRIRRGRPHGQPTGDSADPEIDAPQQCRSACLWSGRGRGCRRWECHGRSQTGQWRGGNRDQTTRRPIEVEGDKEHEADQQRCDHDTDNTSIAEPEEEGQQRQRHRGADQFEASTAVGTRLFSADARVVWLSIMALRLST